jgi:hypothetical protein
MRDSRQRYPTHDNTLEHRQRRAKLGGVTRGITGIYLVAVAYTSTRDRMMMEWPEGSAGLQTGCRAGVHA